MGYTPLLDYLEARLAASQVANFAVGMHVEWDIVSQRGTRITMATGAGQADGIFTLAANGLYEVSFGMSAEITAAAGAAGQVTWHLRTNPGAANVLDDAGQVIRCSTLPPSGVSGLCPQTTARTSLTVGGVALVSSLDVVSLVGVTAVLNYFVGSWMRITQLGFVGV